MYLNHRSISTVAVLGILTLPVCNAYAASVPVAAADSYEHIYKENVFDPKRAPWAVATPVPSIPPPSANDIQLYGVINVGTVKRALFKLSPMLAGIGKKPFVSLAEGQSVGSYQVAEIQRDQVILSAGEARYPMRFMTKTDRSVAGIPISAPTQSAMELPPAMPTIVPSISPVPQPVVASAPSAAAAPPQPSATPPVEGQQAQAKTADAAQPAPQAAAPIQGATLLEAIEAARRAQAAGQPSYPNPFTK